MEKLKKIAVETTVDAIVHQVITNIINGTFQPGERIPTEAELAAALGVGRNSVREAIKILSAYGILEIRRADGTFVCSDFSPRMLDPMVYGIILSRNAADLVEVRKAVETYSYYLASRKATEDDIRRLSDALDRYIAEISKEPCDYRAVSDLDAAFHNTLCSCGHNQILLKINEIVCLLLYESRLQTIRIMIERGDRDFLINVHRKSFDVVRNHSIDLIEHLVDESIMNWDAYLKAAAKKNS